MLQINITPENILQKKDTVFSEQLLQMLSSHYITQAIYVAAKLGIADLLKEGAKSSDELAALTNVDTLSLCRLLRALAGLGIFAEVDCCCFETTPLAKCLQTDVPDSMRSIAILEGEEWLWQSWGNMLNAVKTGISGFEQKFGMKVVDYLGQHPELGKSFKEALNKYSAIVNNAVLATYDFSSVSKVVDVGGGHGALLATILKANPTMTGILFDLPSFVERAKEGNDFQTEELSGRYEMVGGDFFEAVPSGGNTYILKQIIHNWDDDRAIQILQNCYCAMPEDGKLLVIDPVILSNNEPSFATFLDLQLLVTNSGSRIRTANELQKLFANSGFQIINIIPTESPCSIIEGFKSNDGG